MNNATTKITANRHKSIRTEKNRKLYKKNISENTIFYQLVLFISIILFQGDAHAIEETYIGLPPPAELHDFLKQENIITDSEIQNPETEEGETKSFPTKNRQPGILKVGPNDLYRYPSRAAIDAIDGDLILIDAKGNYDGDEVVWRNNDLTIRGVGGRARITNRNIKNGKALWVITGNNITIENIEFSDAKVKDGNGAGIRMEGSDLDIRYCSFHNNENGILTGANKNSKITIEYSEFYRNGGGEGKTHNIYIGNIRELVLRFNYIHHAIVGHNVKSRADINYILFNRIMDENEGKASYQIDIPNGGVTYIVGNIIQQGPKAENWAIIAYGLEGINSEENKLILINNTIINDKHDGLFLNLEEDNHLVAINNIFGGKARLPNYNELRVNNYIKINPEFVDRKGYDYRLKKESNAIDKGVDHNLDTIKVDFEYFHKRKARIRQKDNNIDFGAFEFIQ